MEGGDGRSESPRVPEQRSVLFHYSKLESVAGKAAAEFITLAAMKQQLFERNSGWHCRFNPKVRQFLPATDITTPDQSKLPVPPFVFFVQDVIRTHTHTQGQTRVRTLVKIETMQSRHLHE